MALNPTQIMPRRNPGIVQRVMDLMARLNPGNGPQPEERDTSQSGQVLDATSRFVGNQFNLSDQRGHIYLDADDMDRMSEEVSVALDTIADNTLTSEDGVQQSFQATSKDAKVQEVLDQTNAVCNLHQAIRPWVRNVVKYGDGFTEIVINGELELVGLKQLPPGTMHRNQDPKGNLLMGRPQYASDGECSNEPEECAFDQRDPEDPDKVVAAFYPWQVCHTRLNWDGFSPYGRSLLRVTRYAWKKLVAIEEALRIARITRAYLKLIHYIDTTGLDPIEKERVVQAYKTAAQTRSQVDSKRDAQLQVMTDFFITSGYVRFSGQPMEQMTKVDTIDPKNDDLHNIDDIDYLHRKLISTLRVPPAHMGFERDLNAKATLTQQDVQYVRYLRSIQQLMGQSLEQVYNTALALAGIDPATAEYRIAWPLLKATDELSAAEAYYNRAQANAIYLGHSQINAQPVIDPQYVLENELELTPEDAEEVAQRVAEQAQVERQQAQEDAQQQHENQIALVKAKPAAAEGPPSSSKRPVAAEVTQLVELLRESRLLVLDPALVQDKSGGQGVHLHLHKGAIENHIDPGAVVVNHEHHSHVPVTVVPNGSHPEGDDPDLHPSENDGSLAPSQ